MLVSDVSGEASLQKWCKLSVFTFSFAKKLQKKYLCNLLIYRELKNIFKKNEKLLQKNLVDTETFSTFVSLNKVKQTTKDVWHTAKNKFWLRLFNKKSLIKICTIKNNDLSLQCKKFFETTKSCEVALSETPKGGSEKPFGSARAAYDARWEVTLESGVVATFFWYTTVPPWSRVRLL